MQQKITALALFSGGLDSILACRVVMAQGIQVKAIKFVAPFFGYELLAREDDYVREVADKYGIDVSLVDISDKYLKMLRSPVHGYGKHFNPCVDCKILLLAEAREMMKTYGASFLITGEVLGQRPMSQRRDTLRVIERDSVCEGILVRPLCAKNLSPTKPELEGLIDRQRLLGFKGRSRTAQMELAKEMGITDYPSPAGGCTLTDPVLGDRIERFYQAHDAVAVADMQLMMVGRHFELPQGGWLVVGRNKNENERVESLQLEGDWLLAPDDRPGPTALLRFSVDPQELQKAAMVVARYGKKGENFPEKTVVKAVKGEEERVSEVSPAADQTLRQWRR